MGLEVFLVPAEKHYRELTTTLTDQYQKQSPPCKNTFIKDITSSSICSLVVGLRGDIQNVPILTGMMLKQQNKWISRGLVLSWRRSKVELGGWDHCSMGGGGL